MSSRPPVPEKPKTKFIRDFTGAVNISTTRDNIADNELWWLEGMMPLKSGGLRVLSGPSVATGDTSWHAAVNAESGQPSFIYNFSVAGTDYLFVVYKNSGNGYIGDLLGFSVTKVFTGTLTSGQTDAAQWNNQGLLIVDPAGYWDWNVTTASTLTALNNSVQSFTINDGGVYTTFPAGTTLTGGGGTGGSAASYQGIGSAIPLAAGIGYKVGDVLTFNFTLALAPGGSEPQLTVTTVNATGGVTGYQITNPGQGLNIGGACPSSSALTGGAGTGATATLSWALTLVLVASHGNGSGYTSAPIVGFTGGVATRAAAVTATVSGNLGGTQIESYAGRAWIANGRTVIFTDAGSYNSFVGSGSEFTIDDSYLHDNITALFAANTYLYIFGADSIDVLSNVTIDAAGDAQFSRVNVSASIGCDQPNSIFSYYRGVMFGNSSGFYNLTGASPEPISEPLDLLIPTIDFLTNGALSLSGCQASVDTVGGVVPRGLYAIWSITFSDTFVTNTTRTMLLMYRKGKWFFASQALSGTPLTFGPIFSIPPAAGNTCYQLYTIDSTKHLYGAFTASGQTYWHVRTKLYDCGTPMWTKQAMSMAVGVNQSGTLPSTGVTFTVDTENADTGATSALTATSSGYHTAIANNNQAAGQFMGMGLNGGAAATSAIGYIQWAAFRYRDVTEWAA